MFWQRYWTVVLVALVLVALVLEVGYAVGRVLR